MKDLLDKLSERCWKTAIARFESARRMKRCHNASTLCIAMLSVEIIVINLLVFIDSLNLNDEIVTVTTVCLSTFVLVLSLIVSQLKYDKREENYHECAVELSNLEKTIQICIVSGNPITYGILMQYNHKYNTIIGKWNLNHSSIDYEWALYKHSKYDGCGLWLWIKWHLLRSDAIYHMLTILGALAIIITAVCAKDAQAIPPLN